MTQVGNEYYLFIQIMEFNPKRSDSVGLKYQVRLFFMTNRPTFVPPNRGVEQLVARWAHNPKVACSSHAPATKVKAIQ